MVEVYLIFFADKGNFVALTNSSILGKDDGPNKLVSLACTFIAQQRKDKVDCFISKLTAAP